VGLDFPGPTLWLSAAGHSQFVPLMNRATLYCSEVAIPGGSPVGHAIRIRRNLADTEEGTGGASNPQYRSTTDGGSPTPDGDWDRRLACGSLAQHLVLLVEVPTPEPPGLVLPRASRKPLLFVKAWG